VEQEQQDHQQQWFRWPPTRRQLFWIGVFAALAFLLIVVCGYLFGWKWTGLPKQTLWDWLDLLIVPFVLAVGGYLFTRSESRRAEQSAIEQRNLDRETAEQRTKEDRWLAHERAATDRQIADQRRQDDTLQAYLDQIGQLLLDKENPLRQSEEGDEVRTLARVRTLTVLTRLDGDRRGSVLQFLYESRLITQSRVIVDLKGADVSEADLTSVTPTSANLNISSLVGGGTLSRMDLDRISRVSTLNGADLGQVNLSRVNLSGTDLFKTDLSRANLSGADLSGALLSESNLASADLSGAKLVGADLSRVELSDANLSGADLRNADLRETTFLDANLSSANLKGAIRWDEELLRGAKTLAGATMPDGQTLRGDKRPNGPTFEDWLKSKDRAEDGQNDGSS
jgi:uncharacterized protein YjbI with pentapeptide repeats